VHRLTGDFITSSEIGHLKKVGTVMYRSSLPIFPRESNNKQRNPGRERERDGDRYRERVRERGRGF
jgi:hypothetical protein